MKEPISEPIFVQHYSRDHAGFLQGLIIAASIGAALWYAIYLGFSAIRYVENIDAQVEQMAQGVDL